MRSRTTRNRTLVWCILLAGVLAARDTGNGLRFEEVGEKRGVRVVHRSRRFMGKYADVLRMFTSGGAAAAVGDYNNDGFDDIFMLDSDTGRPHHLFRNGGDGSFTDVAKQAGVSGGNTSDAICADALWFDYDNDGHEDLLIARFGTPILYLNTGDGEFKDVTGSSGLTEFGNTIAVIAFDYDSDGLLDLLFGDYFQPVNLLDLESPKVLPDNLDDAHNGGGVRLYRNTGKQFVNVTEKAGLANHDGWTLDLGHADYDNDGDQDLYVAADYGTDRLYRNEGNGKFTDVTESAIGIDTKKGMNIDWADYDNDGWLDAYITNITDEYMREGNFLWRNSGDGTFIDVSKETSTHETGWGWAAKFADFDNDGWQDLFVVTGLRSAGTENYITHVFEMLTRPGVDFSDLASWPDIGAMSWSGYQKQRLFRNDGTGGFAEVGPQAGVANDLDGRGIALGDFDNDGRTDIYQTNADQPALLHRNVTAAGNWVSITLRGIRSNRFGIGARVRLIADGNEQIREINGGNGYSGQSAKRAHFGLGSSRKVDSVEVRWPSGITDRIKVSVNKRYVVEEGNGLARESEAP